MHRKGPELQTVPACVDLKGKRVFVFIVAYNAATTIEEVLGHIRNGEGRPPDFSAPDYFPRKSARHAKQLLAELNDNDDKALPAWANSALGKGDTSTR